MMQRVSPFFTLLPTLTNGSASGEGAAQAVPEGDASGFPAGSYDVLMIGDSVSLRAVSAFDAAFPHGHIDAAKSRQFTAGAEAYASYVQQNLAGKIAVFALGTNGLVTDEAIDSLMATVGEDRIAVFVNTRSPQPWVQATNDALARAPQRYANARVIDWFGYSAGRNDLFDGDGTHLSASGAQEYVNLIYENVKADLPLHPEDHANDPAVVAVHNALNQSAAALAPKAAEALALTADRLFELGLVDRVISEPLGGAHRDCKLMATTLKKAVVDELRELMRMPREAVIERRMQRLAAYGRFEEKMQEKVEGVKAKAAE